MLRQGIVSIRLRPACGHHRTHPPLDLSTHQGDHLEDLVGRYEGTITEEHRPRSHECLGHRSGVVEWPRP